MSDYKSQFEMMVIDPTKSDSVASILKKIIDQKDKYLDVEKITTVPWYVVAAIHYRESSLNFARHLHNGDKLSGRTIHVPKGRPLKGSPPFTWVESAVDALKLKSYHTCTDWSIENTLNLLERYNGLGYKKKGLPSPYLWAWSSNYKKGKYVADGKFDPNFVDQQCGTAVLLKMLM